jgi:hypothetical protein
MTPQQLLAQLKGLTQAGRFAYLQKAATAKLVKQKPATK